MNSFLFYVLLRKKKVSLEQLAQKVGMSTQALYLRVEGRRGLKLSEVQKISQELQLNTDEIMNTFFTDDEE